MPTPSETKIITLLTELRDLQLDSNHNQVKNLELYQETQTQHAKKLEEHLANVKATYEGYLNKHRRFSFTFGLLGLLALVIYLVLAALAW